MWYGPQWGLYPMACSVYVRNPSNQEMLAAKPILIAEDFEPDAKALELTLKKAGVANPLIFVSDGDQAIYYLMGKGIYADREKYPFPGVFLLDLKMPRVDGYEVLRWCRSQPQLSDLVICVLSGYHELQDVARAYQLGASTFLVKPLAVADIQNVVEGHPGPWELSRTPGPRR